LSPGGLDVVDVDVEWNPGNGESFAGTGDGAFCSGEDGEYTDDDGIRLIFKTGEPVNSSNVDIRVHNSSGVSSPPVWHCMGGDVALDWKNNPPERSRSSGTTRTPRRATSWSRRPCLASRQFGTARSSSVGHVRQADVIVRPDRRRYRRGSLRLGMDYRGAIVDLDGTVYRGDDLVPGAARAVDRLRDAGLALLFFSNNPTKSGDAYVDRLRGMGLDVHAGEACSAGDVTVAYLRDHHASDRIMLVGSPGLHEQFRAADLTLTTDPAATDVLVGSWSSDFGYDDMLAALRAVDDDTTFLGTDPDRTVPAEGEEIPGSGAVVGALAATVGRDPDAVLGKPSEVALEFALERLEVDPAACLVVGDRLGTDIALGERAGMTTVLVRTGVTDGEEVAGSDVTPDHVLGSIADIGAVLDDHAE
jgi:HAD superfamily hydrolase (TIGR01450 family)